MINVVPPAPAPAGEGGQLELGDMGSSLTVSSSISMSDATLPELEEDESFEQLRLLLLRRRLSLVRLLLRVRWLLFKLIG